MMRRMMRWTRMKMRTLHLVLMDPASEPLLGSVRAKAANCSPVACGWRGCDTVTWWGW